MPTDTPPSDRAAPAADTRAAGGMLGAIERIGNALPSPFTLFLLGTCLVAVVSAAAAAGDWSVKPLKPQVNAAGEVTWSSAGTPLKANSLISTAGVYWLLSHLVTNFMQFPPLGVVLVSMLGIGVAEATGLMDAVIKALMLWTPRKLLTPMVILVGILSSMTLDAGYLVLPPVAAALFRASGRSPVAGIAAAFAGVAAGFNANLLITGLDPMLARLSSIGAQVVAPDYQVAVTCNWYFMIVSTVTMTLTGWSVSAWFVEPRLAVGSSSHPAGDRAEDFALSPGQWLGLRDAGATLVVLLLAAVAMTLLPGAPLAGQGEHFARWVECIVPLIFVGGLLPGIVFGIRVGAIQRERDVADILTKTAAALAPILVLAFVAAQFIECFKYSNLDKMLAMTGGGLLATFRLPPLLLLVAFVLVTFVFNLLVGSMSAKYTIFAPIIIPMLMVAGISPELTQAAYRVGDSVSNVITPLNPYVIIILVLLQKYESKSGMGTLIATMLPYAVAFTVVWTTQLLVWVSLGIPLGIDGPLRYVP